MATERIDVSFSKSRVQEYLDILGGKSGKSLLAMERERVMIERELLAVIVAIGSDPMEDDEDV